MIIMTNINHGLEWCFEKIFDECVSHDHWFQKPFSEICSLTFFNVSVVSILESIIMNVDNDYIKSYLINNDFISRFLKKKINNKLFIAILTNNLDSVEKITLHELYTHDLQSLCLAVVNNLLPVVKMLLANHEVNNHGLYILLEICATYGYDELYFYFIDNFDLVPNAKIYTLAVCNDKLSIVEHVNKYIGLTDNIIKLAFQSNHTANIKFIVETAKADDMKIDDNLWAYPILNNNNLIIELMSDLSVKLHDELYYSAVLSGSISVCEYLELLIPHIHTHHKLDVSRVRSSRKIKNTFVTSSTMYTFNNEKYFSHTMNYAIQSESISMVKYIHQKKYGISISNIITAIRQSTPEILQFVCDNFYESIPTYIYYYLGMESFIADKKAKSMIIMEKIKKNKSSEMKRKNKNDRLCDSFHIHNIRNTRQISTSILDIDHVMKYNLFFSVRAGSKIDPMLCAKLRVWIVSSSNEYLNDIYTKFDEYSNDDRQIIVDMITIYGTCHQFIDFYKKTKTAMSPSPYCIMEIMCYSQYGKLCYLKKSQLIVIDEKIQILAYILGEINLCKIMNTDSIIDIAFAQVLETDDNDKIMQWLNTHPDYTVDSMKLIKKCIDMDKECIFTFLKINTKLNDACIEYAISMYNYQMIHIFERK